MPEINRALSIVTPEQRRYIVEKLKTLPVVDVLQSDKEIAKLPLYLKITLPVKFLNLEDKAVEESIIDFLIDEVGRYITESAGGKVCLWHKYLIIHGWPEVTAVQGNSEHWISFEIRITYELVAVVGS